MQTRALFGISLGIIDFRKRWRENHEKMVERIGSLSSISQKLQR